MPLAEHFGNPEDASELSPSGPYRAIKQAGLVLLCAAWITLGLFGHDPWKPDDATNFGIAFDMAKSGDYLVPQVAGVAIPERAPLFHALAATTARLFSPLLALHNGARLATGLWLAATLWLLGLTGRELNGRAFRWLPVLVFIGCVGLWERAHFLAPDIGVLAAYSLALYALALAPRRCALGGVLLGLAAGIAFMCKGALAPSLIAATALLLPLSKTWRTRGHLATLGIAIVVAAPLIAIWPLALYLRDPSLFARWYNAQNIARFFGQTADAPSLDYFYYLKNLPWFAWPALPLALWTLWIRLRGRNGGVTAPGIVLPGIMFAVQLIVLSVASIEPRAMLTLWMLLPLSLLASAEVDTLKRGFSGALDWFGILTFGLVGILLWGLWLEALRNGLPEQAARLFRDTQPGYQPPLQVLALVAAIFLSILWIVLVRPARRSNRRAILNWAAGMTLVWGLYTTIWLPYLDSRRSYRPVAESLAVHLPAGTCVASRNLGEPQRALLEYFIGLTTVREEIEPGHACKALLMQVGRDDSDVPPDSAWEKVWEGRRRGDDTERFLLFRRPVLS